ncbi:hypothetical protein ASD22_11120 [Rhodanobacter sp. Root480]|nr:hypothetical protein ASD22_11120 [Rhodanobacter sp. Root480]
MIVSNSCDISGENERPLPVSVLVAPLASMAKLRETFAKGGYAKDSIESRLRSIRMQETTDMFFLPGGGELEEDSVVLLDAIQAVRREFLQLPDKRLCTLSQAAFYMLLIKLSVHLCRAGERIDREAA